MSLGKKGLLGNGALGNHRDPFGAIRGPEATFQQQGQVPKVKTKAIPLTPTLIEGFVHTYLAAKYDHRTPTPEFHRELWELFCRPEAKIVAAAPRGHAKSTAITEAYVLADILFRNSDYVVVVSETYPQAVEFIREYKTELANNDELRRDFGIKKFLKDTEDDIIVQFDDGAQFRIKALASEGAVRGIKWNKKRPNKIVFDDIEGDEQVQSPTRREKLRSWFFKALLPAGGKECKVRGVGTILHFDSMLARLIKNRTWTNKVFKAHANFSDFSNILWPEMFSEARLREIKENYVEDGNPDGYSCEYLNEPIAEGDTFFKPEYLLDLPLNFSPDGMNIYASWDFAVSTAQKADYTACGIIAVDAKGCHYVLDMRRGRWDTMQTIDEIFIVEQAWKPSIHFMEEGVIQKSLGPFLNAEMRRRGIYPSIETMVPTKDKISRARSWQAKTRARHVFYDKEASWWVDLLEEMKRFPKAAHDDQVDVQSQFGLMLDSIQDAPSLEELDDESYFRAREQANMGGRSEYTGY